MYRNVNERFVLESKENIAENMASFSLKVSHSISHFIILSNLHLITLLGFEFISLRSRSGGNKQIKKSAICIKAMTMMQCNFSPHTYSLNFSKSLYVFKKVK